MNRTCLLLATLSLAVPLASPAQSTGQTAELSSPMSASELQSLIKSAHSTAQYQQLATYYHQRETMYRSKAADEKAERDRRAQVNAALMQKYPRPVDSSQYRYEAFSADADRAAVQAAHYDQLATGAHTQHDGQLASSN
jgi:hypothetical protein